MRNACSVTDEGIQQVQALLAAVEKILASASGPSQEAIALKNDYAIAREGLKITLETCREIESDSSSPMDAEGD